MIRTGSRSCFDTTKTKPFRRTNLVGALCLLYPQPPFYSWTLIIFSQIPSLLSPQAWCSALFVLATRFLMFFSRWWLKRSAASKSLDVWLTVHFILRFERKSNTSHVFSLRPKSMRRNWNGMLNFYWSTLITHTRGSAEWQTSTSLAWLRREC